MFAEAKSRAGGFLCQGWSKGRDLHNPRLLDPAGQRGPIAQFQGRGQGWAGSCPTRKNFPQQ